MQIDTMENIHPICYAPLIHTETQQTCFSPQAPNIPTITQDITNMATYNPYAFGSKYTYNTCSAYT